MKELSNKDFTALFGLLCTEISFSTARSGGSGGQHVNKVETKVILKWNPSASEFLTEKQRDRLVRKLAKKITNDGDLVIYHQTERSQLKNKAKVVKKFREILKDAFHTPKKRKKTKPSKSAKLKTKKNKKNRSQLKKNRKRPDLF